ncbi:hypothetical protein BEN47_10900 [Hymenobacter lapidarius]|uniref:CBM-cenC domain-containing protein n=2 Tax=Hymenobacter lapidarius TaxID=1908237 RepID=A0A1G1T973_9BACT|nr:hypothetical protein BEN47_10900 [Hymenobacter lapidarius]
MFGSLYFQNMSAEVSPWANQGQSDGPWIHNGTYGTGREKAKVYHYYHNYSNSGSLTREVGADLQQEMTPADNGDYLRSSLRQLSIAHDDFSVMGAGVSGNIRPYRLEMGSVASPKKGAATHYKYSVTPYLNDYKVPFRYDNSAANGYDYHFLDAGTNPDVFEHLGIATGGSGSPSGDVDNNGLVIKDPRLKSRYDNIASTAPARKGIRNQAAASGGRDRALVQGKHVAWWSNEEIMRMYATSTDGDGSMLEFYKPASRPAMTYGPTGETRQECTNDYGYDERCWEEPVYDSVATGGEVHNPWRLTLPGKGIGAYAVTAEDGTTYHYSLPVYHYSTFTKSTEKNPTQGSAGVATTRTGTNSGAYAYATTWLLTAITSSDYVDRGQRGVVDDADWGGWVKFDYGKFAARYKWRQPYVGSSYTEDDNADNFMEGSKQTYYLNSIRTRTHTALFVKSVRRDARGHFTPNGQSNLGLNEAIPASSLRLDEIVLLTNQDLARLQTENGIRQPGDNATVPALSNNTGDNAQSSDAALRGGSTYRYVLDQQDLSADARIRAFVNAQALKRVVFNYSYRLCPGTPNSFASLMSLPAMDVAQISTGRSGKLTLESLSTYGPQTTKLMPDFLFRYGNNPSYHPEKWDGFGLYNGSGYAGKNGHAVSWNHETASQDGAAWSLAEVVTPLGSKTQFTYERDQYAHVSEFGTKGVRFANTDCSATFTASNAPGDLQQYYRPGDYVKVDGTARYGASCSYYDAEYGTQYYSTDCEQPYKNQRVRIASVTPNTITLDPADAPGPAPCTADESECGPMTNLGAVLYTTLPATVNGGDIRVAAVTTLDETNRSYQVRYRYQDETALPIANSAGVISKEPEFVTRVPHAHDNLYDYPSTPVMYSKVIVLRGNFANNSDADHDQREEYGFVTPSSDMIQINERSHGQYYGFTYDGSTIRYVNLATRANHIKVDVGQMGQATIVRKRNRRGEVEFATTFNYAKQMLNADGIAGQGKFTEGVVTNEMLNRNNYRINRSTKEYVPTVLASTTTVANGMRVTTHNDLYDFFTGQVLETRAQNALGDELVTKTVPAYTLAPYAAMGPKSENGTNRNMLTQTAATYVYKKSAVTPLSLLSASVQTWKNAWLYRTYNAAADRYEDVAAPYPVWRQHETYVWNGARLNSDGTYAGVVAFDWSRLFAGGQHVNWLKLGESTRYDEFSRPLEARGVNGRYAASKAGNGQTQTFASAGNARYTEMAYSGAEDQLAPLPGNGAVHFGGEVRDGGRRDASYHHAGLYSSKLTAGQTGFTYRAVAGDAQDVRVGRQYRLSAWVHSSDAGRTNGRLYATLNGTTLGEASVASPTTKKAGEWYLLNLYVTVPASATGQLLVVGTRHAGITNDPVYVDDFRFHPLTGPLTAYNHDPHTGLVTYVLDNNNLYTRFQYDNAGKMIRISKETLDQPGDGSPAEKPVKEHAYNYARMRVANWHRTGEAACATNPDGSPTGYRRYRIQDINPLSSTYNALDWEPGEYTNDCPPCGGPHTKWVSGSCETAYESGCVDSQYNPSTQMYTNIYRYVYSDGTYDDEPRSESFQCLSYRVQKASQSTVQH